MHDLHIIEEAKPIRHVPSKCGAQNTVQNIYTG